MMPGILMTPSATFGAAFPNLCAPTRATFAPPAWVFGPFAAFAPVWVAAMDPRTNPWLAVGVAFGPFAWAARYERACT